MSEHHAPPLYPLFIDLEGRRVLVVGAGPVAERRVSALLVSGACVTVVAPLVIESIAELADAGTIVLERRRFRDSDVAGQALVFSATGDVAVDRAVSVAGRAAGIPVNVADDVCLSDFHVPAVFSRGDVQVAVSTRGSAPGLAGRLRDRLAEMTGSEWGRLAHLLGEVRRLAKMAIPDASERMATMRNLACDDRLLEDLAGGLEPKPAALLSRALAQGREPGVTDRRVPGCGTEHRRSGDAARGFVSIVGAGPGDPGLITVAGQRRIREADVIVYDDLVDRRLLSDAPANAELIYAGKRGWLENRSRPGPDILVSKALEGEGKHVVRLKGGDPAVFGRLAEELEALDAAGVAHDVIPGVTAALAAAAGAKVALTRKGVSSSIMFATAVREGSVVDGGDEAAVLLRRGGTLALYMGLKSIQEFATGLVSAGVDSRLPVLAVSGASTASERAVETTLADASAAMEAGGLASPVLVLVGRALSAGESSRGSPQA